ncbi:HGxxPAAW family protein [Streptomyces sp. NPDC050416]|uniref:HGxxPAAW family protein n=1 Tax=Streptomyces sp. NPDC050416 TaxID=3365611 RepID=UPI0037A4FD19
MSAHQYDHGHTVAGWVGTGIGSVGAVVAGAGVCFVSGVLIAGGLAIGVVGLLVTWALHLAGWGKGPGIRPREEWGWRVRDSGARAGHDECLGCRLAGRGRTAGSGRVTEVARGASVRGEAEPAAVGADSGR